MKQHSQKTTALNLLQSYHPNEIINKKGNMRKKISEIFLIRSEHILQISHKQNIIWCTKKLYFFKKLQNHLLLLASISIVLIQVGCMKEKEKKFYSLSNQKKAGANKSHITAIPEKPNLAFSLKLSLFIQARLLIIEKIQEEA